MPDTDSSVAKPRASRSNDTTAEPANPANRPPESSDNIESAQQVPREYGGRKGPDPVRYGDWEKNGRCIDF